jgi:hypothetical protein
MIQHANDPNASRTQWRPTAADGKGHGFAPQRRSAHAWPFIARHSERPTAPGGAKTPNSDSGS